MKLDRVIAVRNYKTIYQDGDKCIKVFGKEYSKDNVFNEALNQTRMEKTGIKIPKILEVTQIDGRWAIVSEYISGNTLTTLISQNQDKQGEYIKCMVDLQSEIISNTSTFLERSNNKMLEKIINSDLDAVTRYDLHSKLEAMPKKYEICHGEFRPSNIIISDDGEKYVIDWTHVTSGDGLSDVARTYLILEYNYGIDFAKEYLEQFVLQNNINKSDVYKWISIVAATQSVLCNTQAKEFFLSKVKNPDKE